MAKINRVKKSRKEQKCGKCGVVLPIGSEYLHASLNFGPTFKRCTKCGLQSWEVTTSDYLLRIGSFQNEWQANYGTESDAVESIVSDIQELLDETQEKLDNMPEGLQEGDTGCLLQERIDALESAISDLESIDYPEMEEDDQEELTEDQLDDFISAVDEALGNLC